MFPVKRRTMRFPRSGFNGTRSAPTGRAYCTGSAGLTSILRKVPVGMGRKTNFARMITFYGYKKCSTCRKAEKALAAAKREFAFVDITEKPPAKAELKRILGQSGLAPRKLFNTSGEQYKLLGMKDKAEKMGEDEILAALAKNGRLIKRPLITDGKKSTVGFDEKVFAAAWK
jgi:arsenate reductase